MGVEVLLAAAFLLSAVQGGVLLIPQEIDFGEVMEDEPRKASILVENHASTLVSLTERSAACSRLTWGTFPIEPGATARIDLVFPPENRLGYFSREVAFSVSPTGQPVSVRLVGTIVPGLRASPQVVRLLARAGEPLPQRRLEVTAGKPFRITAMQSSDPRIAVARHSLQVEARWHELTLSPAEQPVSEYSAELILDVVAGGQMLELRVPVRVSLE